MTRTMVHAGGIATELCRGGRGAPLLILHGELGLPGWIPAFERLAAHRELIVPSLPGYGSSDRPDWIMSVRDLAAWVSWVIRDIGLDDPVDVVGFSMGGWIAAELAVFAPQLFRSMVLVGAMGLKPLEGEIWDYFLASGEAAFRRAFHRPETSVAYQQYYAGPWSPEQTEAVERHREMTCRVAWKPYMHSLTLPSLLQAVATPTLLVWGREDGISPLGCAQGYQRAIPGARQVLIDQCGHMPELEQPEAFASVVLQFLDKGTLAA
jgi:pimeloyl-ACP methyl ester carboxylesterase